MKIICAILSIHILFLTAMPSFLMASSKAGTEHCKKSCCTKESTSKNSTKQNNDCCKDDSMCNPFMSCCNCYALMAQSQGLYVASSTSSQKFISLTEALNFNYLSDCFHPPEIV